LGTSVFPIKSLIIELKQNYIKHIGWKKLSILFSTIVFSIIFSSCFSWSKNVSQWGITDFIFTFYVISYGFYLVFFANGKKQNKIILWFFSGFYIIFLFWRFISISEIGFRFRAEISSGWSWYDVLPLNICNITQLFIIAKPLYDLNKNKKLTKVLDQYILFFSLIGFLSYFLVGMKWNLALWDETMFFDRIGYHYFFITYFIFVYGKKIIIPNKWIAIKNMFWIIPIYFILVFTNQIFYGYHFFTGYYRTPLFGDNVLNPLYEWMKNWGNIRIWNNDIDFYVNPEIHWFKNPGSNSIATHVIIHGINFVLPFYIFVLSIFTIIFFCSIWFMEYVFTNIFPQDKEEVFLKFWKKVGNEVKNEVKAN
jgi:hypothetical protein